MQYLYDLDLIFLVDWLGRIARSDPQKLQQNNHSMFMNIFLLMFPLRDAFLSKKMLGALKNYARFFKSISKVPAILKVEGQRFDGFFYP